MRHDKLVERSILKQRCFRSLWAQWSGDNSPFAEPSVVTELNSFGKIIKFLKSSKDSLQNPVPTALISRIYQSVNQIVNFSISGKDSVIYLAQMNVPSFHVTEDLSVTWTFAKIIVIYEILRTLHHSLSDYCTAESCSNMEGLEPYLNSKKIRSDDLRTASVTILIRDLFKAIIQKVLIWISFDVLCLLIWITDGQ